MHSKNPSAKKRLRFVLAGLTVFVILILAFGIAAWLQKDRQPAFLRASVSLESPLEGGVSCNAQSSLNVPTQITKIGTDYFIVDCYHNQILTSPDLNRPLNEWLVMTDQICCGHTIAGDGTVYLADDTENNRILVFEKKEGRFLLTQTFEQIGIRPHYVVYDETEGRFYALSSMTGELYVFSRPKQDRTVVLEKILSVPELDQFYVRSFTLDGDSIYFVSGNSNILRADKNDLTVLERFPVPPEIAGMVQLTRIQDYFYITVSTDLYGNQDAATLLRVSDLANLAEGRWEEIYSLFVGGGTPYYISSFDGHYYMTEHRIPGHSIWQFEVNQNRLTDIRTIFP